MKQLSAEEYLDQIGKRGSVYGLATMKELLCRLDNPQNHTRFLHIAGTNGKGSVAAFLSTILWNAGYCTGRYTSPAVFSELERFCINGKNITREEMERLTQVVSKAAGQMEADGLAAPTRFEVETAVAFLYFKQASCEIAIVECGLGGELDATNVIETTECSVITAIGKDHCTLLGNTLSEIATHKAGIMRAKVPCVTAIQDTEVLQTLQREADRRQTPLYIANVPKPMDGSDIEEQLFSCEPFGICSIPLLGKHQLENASVALRVIEKLRKKGYRISDDVVKRGLSKTEWKGRLTRISDIYDIFIDGAHNEAAARRLSEVLQNDFSGRHWIFVFGMFADKEYDKVAALMAGLADRVITFTPMHERALSGIELAQAVRPYNRNVTEAESLEEACRMAAMEVGGKVGILAFGSLSFLGRFTGIMNSQMTSVNRVLQNEQFLACMKDLQEMEQKREFCKHDYIHLMDVARIAYLIKLERGLSFSKEEIYLAALLHDAGRGRQYRTGVEHEKAGAELAGQILQEIGVKAAVVEEVSEAIAHHTGTPGAGTTLAGLLYEADKKSRVCYRCDMVDSCNWKDAEKNLEILY